jgi:hypothetical protein
MEAKRKEIETKRREWEKTELKKSHTSMMVPLRSFKIKAPEMAPISTQVFKVI